MVERLRSATSWVFGPGQAAAPSLSLGRYGRKRPLRRDKGHLMDNEILHPIKAPATRRAFLQRAAGTGVATVAGIALIPGLSAAQNQDPFEWITLTDQLKAAAQAGGN